ncbi:MAG: DUF308 domain-containing protein [Pseudomonadales bacterium]|nr:DUF308 domain-containing protein [Pseudomonadales bacterium]
MKSKTWSLIIGILLIGTGVIVLFNPFEGTMAVEIVAAWAFIIGGIMKLIAVFTSHGWKSRLASLVLGAVFLWLGIALLMHPYDGVDVMMLVFGLGFLISGTAKLVHAIAHFHEDHFVLSLLASIVSIGLGIVVLVKLSSLSPILFGVLLGVELLASGIGVLCIRSDDDTATA